MSGQDKEIWTVFNVPVTPGKYLLGIWAKTADPLNPEMGYLWARVEWETPRRYGYGFHLKVDSPEWKGYGSAQSRLCRGEADPFPGSVIEGESR